MWKVISCVSSTCLASFHLFNQLSYYACWLICHACDLTLVMLKVVFELCSPWTHLSHSHTMLNAMSHKHHPNHSTFHHKCHAFHSHCWSVMLSICCLNGLRCLIIKLCWAFVHNLCVCTNSLAHTLSNFSEVLMAGSPSNSRTSTLQSTRTIVN